MITNMITKKLTLRGATGLIAALLLFSACDNGGETPEDTTTTTASSAENVQTVVQSYDFDWNNANVYFLLTDRFNNGNTANDHSYGRGLDRDGNVIEGEVGAAGSFHGGDFAGITAKIKEGYFTDLGVNAIWITPPFEQAHGWHAGDGFAFYAYHGYWLLDFTQPDANYGTEAEFAEMVDTAHEHGIRIVLDVIINHPGYATLLDMDEFGFGELKDGWEDYYYYTDASTIKAGGDQSYMVKSGENWENWWGADWVRASEGFSGYDKPGSGDILGSLSGLPDFKTEAEKEVELPAFLVEKWEREGRLDEELRELDEFFARYDLPRTVLNYQIKWLTDWVRDYGIDGFRCDTAKHVEIEAWERLFTYTNDALDDWRAANPDKAMADEVTDFWTVGEVYDHGVKKDDYFGEGRFDALINFSMAKNLRNLTVVPEMFAMMSERISGDPEFNVMSYISSHDTALFDRNKLYEAASALMLSPGAVQIYYGDESARKSAFPESPYTDLKLRGFMNWDEIDTDLLAHWQILGKFRQRHIAVGAGAETQISASPYFFARTLGDDTVVMGILLEADTDFTVEVGAFFTDGTGLVNAYDGSAYVVEGGSVTVNSGAHGTILLERTGYED